ncbi:MAG: LD-carboxypeptidase [Actinomycetaceae bacterium]|nr:LD-carboxypeptidase [Actinomycetaceae bacterium]
MSHPRPAPAFRPGQEIALLSPSTAGPALNPALHEQARCRLARAFSSPLVEYPTTRLQGAPPRQRARDIEAAFANPNVGAIFATLGGFDLDRVIPHLDMGLLAAHPTRFAGYSDNTHLLNALWKAGVAGIYGGSTNVHFGAGPSVDECHVTSLSRALTGAGTITYTDPPWTQDHGLSWDDERCTSQRGECLKPDPEEWIWDGSGSVSGLTWGGCLDSLRSIVARGLHPSPDALAGSVLILEASEQLADPHDLAQVLTQLGREGALERAAGILIARPPTSTFGWVPAARDRADMRAYFYAELGAAARRFTSCPIVCGLHFGHTRPQQVIPYGGRVSIDMAKRLVCAPGCA